MLAKIYSFTLLGLEAYPVEIEVDIAHGLPHISLVGLADTAIQESKERIKSAIKNSGFDWPQDRITISLAPSSIKKEGTSFDLAIALGILAATEQINPQNLEKYCILGELALDGNLRPVKGVLPVALGLARQGFKNLIIPLANASEASLVAGVECWPIKNIRATVELLNNPDSFKPFRSNIQDIFSRNTTYKLDFSEVKGQAYAKRAVEIAASGGHNILTIYTQYDI